MKRTTAKIRCPTCGHATLRRVRRVVRTRVGRRDVVVRGVEVDECSTCGERLYDLPALTRIREARERSSRTRAA